jgi:nucleotide-binding universal stress UspA family protein
MFTTVVVGADGSVTAKRAVEAAAQVAAQFGAALHIVTAFKSEKVASGTLPGEFAHLTSRSDADALLQDLTFAARHFGVEPTTHDSEGDPVDAIVGVAEKVGADLVVVGNRGMTGVRRVLGSVPNSVAHAAPCSVLIVDTTE